MAMGSKKVVAADVARQACHIVVALRGSDKSDQVSREINLSSMSECAKSQVNLRIRTGMPFLNVERAWDAAHTSGSSA